MDCLILGLFHVSRSGGKLPLLLGIAGVPNTLKVKYSVRDFLNLQLNADSQLDLGHQIISTLFQRETQP